MTTTDHSSHLQRDAEGRLRHLITLDGMSRDEIVALAGSGPVLRPRPWRARRRAIRRSPATRWPICASSPARARACRSSWRHSDSVRTWSNLDMQSSSRVKGETVLDTIYTLQAMQADILVMRDAEPGLPAYVAKYVAPHVCILNAGEAHLSHPTQGLLDALTIRQAKGDFTKLKVLIAGDIGHSRVARSAWHAFTTLGVAELRIAAPEDLMPVRMNSKALRASPTSTRRSAASMWS